MLVIMEETYSRGYGNYKQNGREQAKKKQDGIAERLCRPAVMALLSYGLCGRLFLCREWKEKTILRIEKPYDTYMFSSKT